MKRRKIQYRLGTLEWIKIPTDWKNNKGIVASRRETNMGLAERDYEVKCDSSSEPLMVVEGNWIWWCYPHNQPKFRCDEEKVIIHLKVAFAEAVK